MAKAPRVLILDLSGVLHIDASGLHVLEKIHGDCLKLKTRFIVSGLRSQPLAVAQSSGFTDRLGPHQLQPDLKSALTSIHS